MEKFIAKLIKDFEEKKLTRRQLVDTIKVAAATFAAGEATAHAAPSKGFKTIAVNHISYRCPDYTIARDFYQHLMGMGVVKDNGRQCMMPFGDAGTHLLPRGVPQSPQNYTSSGTVTAPPAQAAAGGAGAGGRGRGNGQQAPQQQQQQQARPQVAARIDHIAFTCSNWDKARAKTILEAWGLYPTEDGDSYHVRDPFGYNLQIAGPGMGGAGSSSNNRPGEE